MFRSFYAPKRRRKAIEINIFSYLEAM